MLVKLPLSQAKHVIKHNLYLLIDLLLTELKQRKHRNYTKNKHKII